MHRLRVITRKLSPCLRQLPRQYQLNQPAITNVIIRQHNSNAYQSNSTYNYPEYAEAPMHKAPRLTGCKIDTKSSTFIQSMKLTKAQVDQLNLRLDLVRQGGGESAVQKHLSRNKMLPRDRIDMLVDPGKLYNKSLFYHEL